jgi:hypothetical protein
MGGPDADLKIGEPCLIVEGDRQPVAWRAIDQLALQVPQLQSREERSRRHSAPSNQEIHMQGGRPRGDCRVAERSKKEGGSTISRRSRIEHTELGSSAMKPEADRKPRATRRHNKRGDAVGVSFDLQFVQGNALDRCRQPVSCRIVAGDPPDQPRDSHEEQQALTGADCPAPGDILVRAYREAGPRTSTRCLKVDAIGGMHRSPGAAMCSREDQAIGASDLQALNNRKLGPQVGADRASHSNLDPSNRNVAD